MVRPSKQSERRNISPKRPAKKGPKTGPKKDKLENGFKEIVNTAPQELSNKIYIRKI